MSQPEKIFREKLENYQRSAPYTAWDRIEKNLDAKNHKLIWLKIAAGILMLVIAGYMFWTNQSVPPSPSVAIIQEPVRNRVENSSPEKVVEIDVIKTPEEKVITTAPTVRVRPKETIPQIVQIHTMVENETIPIQGENLITSNQADIRKAETEVNESMVMQKSTVITYTADEVNAKFLRKKSEPEVVQHETSTGIQKIADVAISIKNNDKGIGDLRQMKDEILTLDFLASNDKRQKK